MKRSVLPIVAIGIGFVACGCVADDAFNAPPPSNQPESKVVQTAKKFRPNAAAGVKVQENPQAPIMWATLVASRTFSTRPDPFALQPKERAYERSQTMERIFGDVGGFSVEFQPVEETVVVPQVEPQPYRRLAGVIVGESVLALIDMGDGKLELIRPGQVIQGWTVASIDSDKAVLRRTGNKLPHEVVVRLETPPPSGFAPGRGGGPGGGGPGGDVQGGGDL